MDPPAFSFAVEIFGVVGATDVVFRSVTSLADLISKARGASGTADLLLSVLNGLAAALGEVRTWAEAHSQSDFASQDGQVVPHDLIPLLQRCGRELDDLRRGMGGVLQPKSWMWKWAANAQFAWSESRIRQSVQILEGYKTSLILLVGSRTGHDLLSLRKSTRSIEHSLSSASSTIQSGIQSLRDTLVPDLQAVGHSQQRLAEHVETTATSLQALDRTISSSRTQHSTEISTAFQSLSEQIASLSLVHTSDYDVSVEGDNLQSIIVPLRLMKSRLAGAVETLSVAGSMSVPVSNVDWFLSEIEDLTKFAYRSAGSPYRNRRPDAYGSSYSLLPQMHTIPFKARGVSRSPSGFLVVDYAEGTDKENRKIRRFRFACFAVGIADLPPSGVAGLFTSYQNSPPEYSCRINRQIRVLNVVSSRSDAFQCARRNDVEGMMQLFSAGKASPFDFDENGRSLFTPAINLLHEDMVLFLLASGADPHMCKLGSREDITFETLLRRRIDVLGSLSDVRSVIRFINLVLIKSGEIGISPPFVEQMDQKVLGVDIRSLITAFQSESSERRPLEAHDVSAFWGVILQAIQNSRSPSPWISYRDELGRDLLATICMGESNFLTAVVELLDSEADMWDWKGILSSWVEDDKRHTGLYDIAELLVHLGANVDDVYGDAPLVILAKAVAPTHPDYDQTLPVRLAQLLLNAGAKIDRMSIYGQTALMYAVRQNCFELTTLLLDNGADVGVRDFEGRTALDFFYRSPVGTDPMWLRDIRPRLRREIRAIRPGRFPGVIFDRRRLMGRASRAV
ncbi:hypothetical protein QBC47DRAFT_366917 [Echria macrotheca]|uniref:Fungal N-terminal domain-containing protein n=1 Tax=Echria macrotheca TaxID=438768 RepID=A0AAJ0FFW5_9PEZI|nr:hypothetical protein QBC47DRAFT_366917 [Echria macrotheca]